MGDKDALSVYSVINVFTLFAQGLFSTLELVPMWSGVDHDVEMFASGIVTEDEGDWDSKETAAQNGGSAAGGAGGSSSGGVGECGRPRLVILTLKYSLSCPLCHHLPRILTLKP